MCKIRSVIWTGIDPQVQVTGIPIANHLARIDNLVSVDCDPTGITEGLLVNVEVAAIIDQNIPPHNLSVVIMDPIDGKNLPAMHGVNRGSWMVVGAKVKTIVVTIAATSRTGCPKALADREVALSVLREWP